MLFAWEIKEHLLFCIVHILPLWVKYEILSMYVESLFENLFLYMQSHKIIMINYFN